LLVTVVPTTVAQTTETYAAFHSATTNKLEGLMANIVCNPPTV